MIGTIKTYQKCPACGKPFPSSKGDIPIICDTCKTQPTKFFISLKWNGTAWKLYHDRTGQTIHSWPHAVAVIGDIRTCVVAHRTGKGAFDPSLFQKKRSSAFISVWQEYLKQYDSKSEATQAKIEGIGRNHLADFDVYQIRDITPSIIDNWWTSKLSSGLSQSALCSIMTYFRAFFRYCDHLDIAVNPKVLTYLASIKVTPGKPKVDKWLTEAEQLQLLDALPKHDRPIFDFLFLTGCRVGEACALCHTDIENETITIRHTLNLRLKIGPVKNKEPRIIPYIAEIKNCILESIKINGLGDFIFKTKKGVKYTPNKLRYIFNATLKKCNLEPIKLKNASRHSFALGLMAKGYDIWQVAKVMNHVGGIKSTEHYVKAYNKFFSEAINSAYGRTKQTAKVLQMQKG